MGRSLALEGSPRICRRTAAASKKAGSKAQFTIDFVVPAPDWSTALATGKASTVLAQATLDKATEQSNTLPEDVHYTVDMLTRLFLRPQWVMRFKPRASGEDIAETAANGEQWYNYENPNDANFCPAVESGGYDSDDGPCDDGEGYGDDNVTLHPVDATVAATEDDSIALDGALIDAPKMAEKIEIKYAKTATKVDVRVVKETMWKAMTDDIATDKENARDAANVSPSDAGKKGAVSCPQSFKHIVHELPSRVAGKNAGEVSVAIAFVCLLHLANEKNLAISGRDAMDDLRIVQNGTSSAVSSSL
eukprot:Opistho-2@80793